MSSQCCAVQVLCVELKLNPYLQLEEQNLCCIICTLFAYVYRNHDGGILINFMYRNWTSKASKLCNLHLGAVGINSSWSGFSVYSRNFHTLKKLTQLQHDMFVLMIYGRRCSNLQKFFAVSVNVPIHFELHVIVLQSNPYRLSFLVQFSQSCTLCIDINTLRTGYLKI
jgi:hypothetical protein